MFGGGIGGGGGDGEEEEDEEEMVVMWRSGFGHFFFVCTDEMRMKL